MQRSFQKHRRKGRKIIGDHVRIKYLLVVLALVISGCAVKNDVPPSQGAMNLETYKGVEVASTPGAKPLITVNSDARSASDLFSSDLIVGDGATVAPGAQVTVDYVGVGLDSGDEFDSSWDRGEPITFGLDQVIQGWSEGVVGMKVGGRRLLVIPGDLAYGANGIPQAGIGPNETLIFVVDLIAIVE